MAQAEHVADAGRARRAAQARTVRERVAASLVVRHARVERIRVRPPREAVAVSERDLAGAEPGGVACGSIEARTAAVARLADEAAHRSRRADLLQQRERDGVPVVAREA